MKILITGGAGFIGSHLAELYLAARHEVFVIDDLSTGSIENIEQLKLNPHFHYFLDTITNQQLLRELIDKCDTIVHLAAAVGVQLIVESPVKTIETNIYGTELVLQYANLKKKKVLIASTSEVYGKSLKESFSEDDDLVMGATTKGRWSYACSKAIDEFLAIAYWKERKLPVVVVRLFNTIGPRQTGRYGMVAPRFVKAALRNEPIPVYGTGEQTRCFTNVNDVVHALKLLLENEQALGRIFNIGSTERISIEELANKIKAMTNSQSEIVHIPYEKAYAEGFEDMLRRMPNVSKLQRVTGFTPETRLDETLHDVIEWVRAQEGL
ncbi:MAG: NAD-dependent epimerase/dehydratase family protein [bacterium]|nr:NAD-dependent epimerase/dehydratase family protein [bacterium]